MKVEASSRHCCVESVSSALSRARARRLLSQQRPSAAQLEPLVDERLAEITFSLFGHRYLDAADVEP